MKLTRLHRDRPAAKAHIEMQSLPPQKGNISTTSSYWSKPEGIRRKHKGNQESETWSEEILETSIQDFVSVLPRQCPPISPFMFGTRWVGCKEQCLPKSRSDHEAYRLRSCPAPNTALGRYSVFTQDSNIRQSRGHEHRKQRQLESRREKENEHTQKGQAVLKSTLTMCGTLRWLSSGLRRALC